MWSVLSLKSPEYVNEYQDYNGFFAVWKGMDEVHGPDKQKREFDYHGQKISGKAVIESTILWTIKESDPGWSSRELIICINNRIQDMQTQYGLPLDRADELPGARIVVAKKCGDHFEVAYVGDCFALGVSDADILMTENQAYQYDYDRYAEIDMFFAQEAGDKTKIWRAFMPVLAQARRVHINNPDSDKGFGVLNGQKQLEKMISALEVPMAGLRYLMLGNMGLTPWALQKDQSRKSVGRFLHDKYGTWGPKTLINTIRHIEASTQVTHVRTSNADLAGLVIEMG